MFCTGTYIINLGLSKLFKHYKDIISWANKPIVYNLKMTHSKNYLLENHLEILLVLLNKLNFLSRAIKISRSFL